MPDQTDIDDWLHTCPDCDGGGDTLDDKSVAVTLAEAVLRATEIREKSWVEDPHAIYDGGHYGYTLLASCSKALDDLGLPKELLLPLHLLVIYDPNSAIPWALDIVHGNKVQFPED